MGQFSPLIRNLSQNDPISTWQPEGYLRASPAPDGLHPKRFDDVH
jgi:hypothetical protein